MNLLLPCFISFIISIYLYYKSYINIDKYLLYFMFIGECILIFGSIYKNNTIIEIAHIIFCILVFICSILFKCKINIYFILLINIIIIITRLYYVKCLFLMDNNNTQPFGTLPINYNYIVYLQIINIILRLLKINST